ncbi:hypothetical protein, partial [Actinobacillus pleuropneumoniae]
VGLGLMPNPSAIILGQRGPEHGRLEIHDNITVPQIKGANQKEGLIRKLFIYTSRERLGGKGTNQFGENK